MFCTHPDATNRARGACHLLRVLRSASTGSVDGTVTGGACSRARDGGGGRSAVAVPARAPGGGGRSGVDGTPPGRAGGGGGGRRRGAGGATGPAGRGGGGATRPCGEGGGAANLVAGTGAGPGRTVGMSVTIPAMRCEARTARPTAPGDGASPPGAATERQSIPLVVGRDRPLDDPGKASATSCSQNCAHRGSGLPVTPDVAGTAGTACPAPFRAALTPAAPPFEPLEPLCIGAAPWGQEPTGGVAPSTTPEERRPAPSTSATRSITNS